MYAPGRALLVGNGVDRGPVFASLCRVWGQWGYHGPVLHPLCRPPAQPTPLEAFGGRLGVDCNAPQHELTRTNFTETKVPRSFAALGASMIASAARSVDQMEHDNRISQ